MSGEAPQDISRSRLNLSPGLVLALQIGSSASTHTVFVGLLPTPKD